MQSTHVQHIEELVQAAMGGQTRRDPIIRDSWQRCVSQHGLDPTRLQEAYIHTEARIREHQDAMDGFLRVARSGVEALYRQVCGLGYVLILTDAKGIAVDFIGDATFDNQLRKAGLYRGADWNEELAGTCAVGTCIATGEALTVHQDDHFDGTHIGLTCTSAPVFSTEGMLAAVLDISALTSPAPKTSQFLALQLVKSFANRIENAHLLNRFRRDWVVQFSAAPEFADIDPDCMIALDGGGHILGFNNRARQVLQATTPLIGRLFTDVFDAHLDDLPAFTRERPADHRTLRLRHTGETLFALAQQPAAAPRPRERPRERPLADGPLAELSGGDPAMDEVVRRAARVVAAGMGLLIQGETGTGKEHVARALHRAGPRATRPFVAVNCAALPESLIESELFGHEPGAFTGAAVRGKRGLVLEAQGGTLFLDEIGDMPLPAQTRLLRVLSEREVMPVGRSRPVPVDIRVLAATHRDLRALIAEGRFREDLYFRLNGAVFTLPPLRERTDRDWLIDRLLAGRRLSDGARALLHRHTWPGNIRELVNVLSCAGSMAQGGTIAVEDVLDALDSTQAPGPAGRGDLAAALQRRQWNVSAVARDLGVDRTTIHRRMRQQGLVPPHKRT